MKIYIIGLPGVGKSTIGEKLSKEIGYTFIDLDTYIEQQAMLFVDEIFHLYGEEYFRALETNALKEVSHLENVVISCGGGIIKNKENKKYMDGPCIYLKAPLSLIQNRVDQQVVERPLLLSKSLEDLYEERKEAYFLFQTLEIENLNIETTINTILKELNMK